MAFSNVSSISKREKNIGDEARTSAPSHCFSNSRGVVHFTEQVDCLICIQLAAANALTKAVAAEKQLTT